MKRAGVLDFLSFHIFLVLPSPFILPLFVDSPVRPLAEPTRRYPHQRGTLSNVTAARQGWDQVQCVLMNLNQFDKYGGGKKNVFAYTVNRSTSVHHRFVASILSFLCSVRDRSSLCCGSVNPPWTVRLSIPSVINDARKRVGYVCVRVCAYVCAPRVSPVSASERVARGVK